VKKVEISSRHGRNKKNVEEVLGKLKGVNEKFALKCMLTKGWDP
jgi:hypothetical protein